MAVEAHAHDGAHGAPVPTYTAAGLTADVVRRYREPSPLLRQWLLITGGLLAIGVIGLLLKIVLRTPASGWGWVAMTFAFIMCTAAAAPLAAIATRLVKGDWRRPFTRAAEAYTTTTLLLVLLAIPLLVVLPTRQPEQRSLWFGFPGAPWVYDWLALVGLALAGLMMLVTSVLPDWAALRALGARGPFLGWAARWAGARKQWRVVQAALTPLGSFYLAMYVFAGMLLATDFAMALVPGWISAIFPAQFSITGLQAGVATLIITLWVYRRVGYEQYIGLDQFWGLAKILLALSLLWFYFWWSEFILFWYGRKPNEQAVLELLMFGPYFIPFLLAFLGSFVLPLLILMWNPIRKSINGPFVVSCIVLVANFLNNIRLFVGPWSLERHGGELVEVIPPFRWPDLADLLIIPGFIGGALFFYLLTLWVVPRLNLWEMKEGLLYRTARRYLLGQVVVVGKPE
jgi:molybdopterin-containing oxidoreductase family membrane subunit